ncbi:MAG: VanZ family protein [Chitinophagaceae bacterium]|nr:MAG: VanZ family protein [Chitinophagaceae bacterium]
MLPVMKPLLDKILFFINKYNHPLSIGWLLLCTILLLLPGNEFPTIGFLQHIYLDKWVHIIIFSSLVFLFCFRFQSLKSHLMIVLVFSILGYIIEWIQKLFIPFRSFDTGDIYADIIGCILGLLLYLTLVKKVNPCGNRGRNQN